MTLTKNNVPTSIKESLKLVKAYPESSIVVELIESLKRKPNEFVDMFGRKPESILLPLLYKLKEFDPNFILKLFSKKYILFIHSYNELHTIFYYRMLSDAILIALLDLVSTLPPYYIQILFLDNSEQYTKNLLTYITRYHSANVIEKALSIILRLDVVYRDKILHTPHIEYSEKASIETHLSSRTSYHVYYKEIPIVAAFDRRDEQPIALAIVKTINERAKHLLIKEAIFQKALSYNNEEVVCYLLEQPDFPAVQIISSIKKTHQSTSHRIVTLMQSAPFYRAIHQTTQSAIPDEIKINIQNSPTLLTARWSEQNTLFHLAAKKQHIAALEFLLTQSIDLNAVNADGLTALDLAFQHDSIESIDLLIEHEKINLHQTDKDNIWPLQRILHYQQYSLAKKGLAILLKALPNEAVFWSLANALNDIKTQTHHQSNTDALYALMYQTYSNKSLIDTLTHCCETANDTTAVLLQTMGILHSETKHIVLKNAINDYLKYQVQSLLNSTGSNHQQAVHLCLIILLFSQSATSINLILNQLIVSIDEKIQLDIVIIKALTIPVIYTHLSYEEHLTIMEFLEEKSLNQLKNQHLLHSNLSLLPTSLLRYFSSNSSLDFLYKIHQQRIQTLLMILTLDKCLQDNPTDKAMSESIQESIKKELLRLSAESIHELKCLLNLITNTDIKLFVKQHLFESQLSTLFLNFNQNLTALLAERIEEGSLLRDVFLSIASNPKILLQPNGDTALSVFISQASTQEIETLIASYEATLQDQNDALKHKLNSSILRGLLNSIHLQSQLRSLFQWSIAYSPYASEQDELISYLPLLLQTVSADAWDAVDNLLIDLNNPYIASLKLLKDGKNIKKSISFLKTNVAIRYDASFFFLADKLPILKTDLFSLDSQLVIEAIVLLLSQKTYTDISRLLDDLPSELISLLLEHTLSGMTNDDYFRAKTCETLLTHLAQADFTKNPYHLLCIKQRLSKQNLDLLREDHLIILAEGILSTQDTSLNETTYNGIWIQRLITSIPFIASSSPEILHRLTERYRLLSLNLKQDEFKQLNRWISGKIPYAEHHLNALDRIRKEMQQDTARREHLLAKRHRLLNFRADDSIRALLNQLEDTCISQQNTNTELVEKALHVLYAYYNQRLSSLRTDYLFKLCNTIFTRARRGDIEMAQNSLFQWLTRYLPHHNFEQSELAKKNDFDLYDSNNQYIGFINESNHALTFIEDELCPLIQIDGFSSGFILYNKDRLRIGELTANGEVKYTNLFQKSTSALMIAKVPKIHLEQSKPALDLLMHDLLHHGELKILYECEEMAQGSEQRAWVEKQLETRISNIQDQLNPDVIVTVAHSLSEESVLTLLSTIQNADNTRLLFKAILEQEEKRTALFEQGQALFMTCLTHISAVTLFTDYLINHNNKPWFHHGLLLFAQSQSSNNQRASLLLEALDKLESDRSSLLHVLLATETHTNIILYQFLSDNNAISIQAAQTPCINAFTSCFSKSHITCLLKSLPQDKPWFTRAQYRLLLMAFLAHHENLFPAKELRLSTTHAWHSDDLIQLTHFTKQHWMEGQSIDKEYAIGQKLLLELAVRMANFGQTHLFYKKNQFDNKIAQHLFTRSTMNTLITQISSSLTNTLHWFQQKNDKNHEEMNLLESEGAIIDWKKMKDESWSFSTGNILPLITTFLLNYSGSTETAKQLIEDAFDSLINKNYRTNLYHITQLLSSAPNRDITRLIFNILHAHVIKNPMLLDETILNHMSIFYVKNELKYNKATDITMQQLALIKSFGQQKQYHAVLIACQLIQPSQNHSQLINHITTEAKTECKLAPFVNKWYFRLFAFLMRTWNYLGKSPSTYVKYCDSQEEYLLIKKNPNTIHTSVLGGENIELQLEQHQDLNRIRSIKARLTELDSADFPQPARLVHETHSGIRFLNATNESQGIKKSNDLNQINKPIAMSPLRK